MASVLAVVAGAPAQAANTSDEHMIDTNDDGKVDSREFAGADRYETSLKLANNYAGGDLGSVSTVIVASGETLIDAVTSAGLAGYKDAPVLLTRSAGISRGVANYIEDHGVGRVIVVGGAASVPDAVLEEIEDLESEPTVTRIAGDDRAATAAAVASELGGDATWCGSDESVAALVNGSDMPAVDAIAIGPMAYALEMPVLLTDSDALPDSTANFLMDANTERVVIVGGEGAVSADVADELSELGVDAVQRIAGDSAAGTSVELAELMLGDCADDLGTSSGMVALINSMATADGISAAPVLGKGIGDSGPIPILLVSDELPAAVRDYLAGTPDEVDGAKTNLTIVAIGGAGVVSEAVMEAALDAAASGPALTVSIDAEAATSSFTVTFSDGLDGTADGFESKLKDIFYVNGAPASIAADDSNASPAIDGITAPAATPSADATCGTAESLTVTLTHSLKAGDEIEVRPTSAQFGADEDKRTLQSASFTVPAPDRDTAAPTAAILAVMDESNVVLLASEDANIDTDKVSIISRRGADVAVANADTTDPVPAAKRITLNLTFAEDLNLNPGTGDNQDADTDDPGEGAQGDPYTLARGDIVVLPAGALTDEATPTPNSGRASRTTVGGTTKGFKVTSIKIGSVDPNVDDDPTTKKIPSTAAVDSDPTSDANDDGNAATTWDGDGIPDNDQDLVVSRNASVGLASGVTISAIWDGDASGAAGNDWDVTVDESSGRDAEAEDAEVDVSINARNKIIRIRYMDGTPTIGELAEVLNGSSSFSNRFTAKPTDGCGVAMDDISSDAAEASDLAMGVSSVGFTVDFNNYIARLVGSDTQPNLVDTILDALITDFDEAADTTTASFVAPYRQVYFRYTTGDASTIPGSRTGPGRGVVEVPAGIATSYQDNIDADNDDGDNDPTTGIAVTDDDPDESQNAASEHRVSSSRSIPIR